MDATEARMRRFHGAVEAVIEDGEYPSGPRIREKLGRPRGAGTLNGPEPRWRRDLLLSLGWTLKLQGGHQRRYLPPEDGAGPPGTVEAACRGCGAETRFETAGWTYEEHDTPGDSAVPGGRCDMSERVRV